MRVIRGKFGGARVVVAGMTLLAVSLGGCSTRGGPVKYDVQGFGAPDMPKSTDFSQNYHIGAGDLLEVTVFRVPNLSGDLLVDGNGNVMMPLLGAVPVQGKTNLEVQSDLVERLGSKYLQSPQVQVVLKSSPRMRVTVDGEVASPGVFPITGETSLLQVIAMARGPTNDANVRRVVVFRTVNGQRMAAAFDLTDIRKGKNPDPVIYGSDIVVVDGSKLRSTFKDVISSIPILALFRPF